MLALPFRSTLAIRHTAHPPPTPTFFNPTNNQYAPWCVWCQRLGPTWEAFAEHVEEQKIPVKVAKVTNHTYEWMRGPFQVYTQFTI